MSSAAAGADRVLDFPPETADFRAIAVGTRIDSPCCGTPDHRDA
jgi:hypothetical protein